MFLKMFNNIKFYFPCVFGYYYYPLCTVFTTIYLKQTTFLRYAVLQLFCIYSLCYM